MVTRNIILLTHGKIHILFETFTNTYDYVSDMKEIIKR